MLTSYHAIKTDDSIPERDIKVGDTILTFAEKMPEFPGGRDSLMNFIISNLKFPTEAYQNGISGKVFVQFAVGKEGKIYRIKVIKGIGGGCDEEVIRLVKLFPDWIPAQQSGQPVCVYYTLPIVFKKEERLIEPKERMPEFPGGNDLLMKYITDSLKYPGEAKSKGICGRVEVQFVITDQGKVEQSKVIRGSIPSFDAEALRVVSSFPNWIPGKHNGKLVPVYFTLPINFKLEKCVEFQSNAQNNSKNTFIDLANEILKIDDLVHNLKLPEYPGGNDSLNQFVSRNLKYPEEAEKNKIVGTVVVGFLVSKDGKIKNMNVLKKVNPILDKEALRVVGLFPNWKAASRNGKNVDYQYSLEFNFFAHRMNLENIDTKEPSDTLKFEYNEQMDENEPLYFVEQMPEFPGGTDAMMRFLNSNMKYPLVAANLGITGRVILQFVVKKDGTICNIKVLRGIGGGCDEEAIRVVKSMPFWKPGKLKGKEVTVFFTLPVVFQLKE